MNISTRDIGHRLKTENALYIKDMGLTYIEYVYIYIYICLSLC